LVIDGAHSKHRLSVALFSRFAVPIQRFCKRLQKIAKQKNGHAMKQPISTDYSGIELGIIYCGHKYVPSASKKVEHDGKSI